MEKLDKFILENFNNPLALIAGLLIIVILIIAPLDSLIAQYIPNIFIKGLIYLIVLLIWILFWFYKRYHFPSNNKNAIGLIIAINAESDKQAKLIKNDFIAKINQLIKANNLQEIINIVIFDKYQSERLNNVLEEGLHDNKKLDKIAKKVKGHF